MTKLIKSRTIRSQKDLTNIDSHKGSNNTRSGKLQRGGVRYREILGPV